MACGELRLIFLIFAARQAPTGNFSEWTDKTNAFVSQPTALHLAQTTTTKKGNLQATSALCGTFFWVRKWKYQTVILTLTCQTRHSSGTSEMWQLSTATLWRYQDVAFFLFLSELSAGWNKPRWVMLTISLWRSVWWAQLTWLDRSSTRRRRGIF